MKLTHKALISVEWPIPQVLAFSTTRCVPQLSHTLQNQLSSPFDSILNVKSKASFNDFNLGLHVGDEEQQVINNRNLLNHYLPEGTNIQWLEQVHGNFVHVVDAHSKHAVIADASYTREKKQALAIMTADCLPIFIANKKGDEIAAIHGGWRPLALGIIENTLRKFSSENSELYAWLGPCIGAKSFEVGIDVYQTFIDISAEFKKAFTLVDSEKGKYLADIQLIATIQLQQLGLTKIFSETQCTFLESKNFFSYRRDGKTGRMASVICIA